MELRFGPDLDLKKYLIFLNFMWIILVSHFGTYHVDPFCDCQRQGSVQSHHWNSSPVSKTELESAASIAVSSESWSTFFSFLRKVLIVVRLSHSAQSHMPEFNQIIFFQLFQMIYVYWNLYILQSLICGELGRLGTSEGANYLWVQTICHQVGAPFFTLGTLNIPW